MAHWALVDNDVVSNIIVADQSFVDTISSQHEAVVNIDSMDPQPELGFLYDSGTQTFSAPPIDYAAILQADLQRVVQDLSSALGDRQGMSYSDVASAISMATDNVGSNFTENEQALWDAICEYVASGG